MAAGESEIVGGQLKPPAADPKPRPEIRIAAEEFKTAVGEAEWSSGN